MSPAETTTLWARALADEVARAGVTEVIVAPGSRSTPLVLAFAQDGRFRMRVHLDERSVGFFALGVGKASGMPAAVITTSGTATANLYPAVVEAAQSETPLLLLTADRPHRLRDADANQAIDQIRMYGPYVRAFFEAAPPVSEGPALRHLRSLAGRAVLAAREAPAGPVHVNLPFDKPLEPAGSSAEGAIFAAQHPLASGGRPDGRAFVDAAPVRREADAVVLDRLAETLAGARRAVLVAGPSSAAARDGAAATRFAAALGIPLLADPLSGARFGPAGGAFVVGGHDLFLRDAYVRDVLAPDLIVRVGASPGSAAVQGWMEHHNGVRHVVVDGGGRWKDHAAIATDYVHADAAATLDAWAMRLAPAVDDAWIASWHTAVDVTRAVLSDPDTAADGPNEGRAVAAVADAMPADAALFISSSMPVRDLDAYASPREAPLRVFGNRGASGIDGIVSTAFGVAAATGAPTACVLGDVAFFHDQNGLLWSRESDAPVVFVLIDNDGGGIFHMLPVREHEPHFTRFFATPHGLDFAHAAAMHGIPFVDVDADSLSGALSSAFAAGGTHVLRLRTERVANQRAHKRVADAVAGSVREALG